MPRFAYKVRDKKGALVSGEAEASTLVAMQEDLFRQGMIPLTVREVKPGGLSAASLLWWTQRVSPEDLMVFTRQFHTLFRAGVSMDTILATLSKQAQSKVLRTALSRIRSDIANGESLNRAFSRHPRVFNDLYVSMLAAGEEAGILEQTLSELAKLIEKEDSIHRNIKSATLYPKIVLVVLIGSVVILMTFVIPKFQTFYGHYSAELPLPTQIMITTSNVVRRFWWIVGAAVIGSWILYRRYYATRTGRFQIDTLRFKFPVFGELNKKVANSRFGHILAALYKSGLPMPRSLEVVATVIGNEAYALEVRMIRDAIQKGSTLSSAMLQQSYFSPVMVETTAVGERTGALDEMLMAVADHYELEVSHTIKNLTTLLEPIMLVGIFGVVAVMALAIFLPIWNMSRVVGGV
ncbi:MAG: type II secretion system F family protein [Deltaproteobacteria bacterium]|nr:type II secretion system F family protein [Deltaproteobacteria bacterium]